MVNNFLRFAMDNFETELVVMGIKLAPTQYALLIDPDEVACFDEFHERFGKYITAHKASIKKSWTIPQTLLLFFLTFVLNSYILVV